MSAIEGADQRNRIYAGIALTSFAYMLFTFQDAAIKLLVEGIAVWQVLFFRSITILAGTIVIGGPGIVRESLASPVVGKMFLRSFLILIAWLCYYTAARDLQLAELTTIYFAAPMLVTALSVWLLGEYVPAFRWIAVVTGFVGVFIACDPANLGFSVPVILVLVAAGFWALSIVLIRKIALSERTLVQLVLNNGFFLVIAGLPLVKYWTTPDPLQLALLIGVGGIGGLAQFGLFEGMKRAPASAVASFEYTSLVWSFLIGWLIWNDFPRPEVFVGAALIVGAGVLIIAGEHFFRRP
ncbi:MAG: DMT family transporter [Rhizobiaceae bacterium]